MVGETSNRTMWLGVAVSLVLHAAAAWALLGGRTLLAEAAFDPSASPPHQEKKIDLGDPESTKMSMSWLGFDEYREHVAAKSEVDQPELTMDPSGARASASRAAAVAAMARAAQAARAARREAARVAEEIAGGLRALESLTGALAEGPGEFPDRDGEAEPAREETARSMAEAEQSEARPEEAREEAQAEATPAEPSADVAPAQASVPGAAGEQDDRESDATSVVQTPRKELGRPVSAQGLRIRTVKPSFSHYASIMSSPRDPVIRIHFDAQGRVKLVDLLQSSGFPDIDRPVLDAAYRWRAEGKALKSLGGSETISVDMRILL